MTDLVRVPLAVAGEAPVGFVDGSGYLHLPHGWRLEWWIGGDDQWHVPAASSSLRQRVVEQTPIVETAMRVPGGDVVWRVGASAHADGATIVCELENGASIPVAIGIALIAPESGAVSRPAVHFTAPARNVAADLGVELLVHPVTHGSTWRCSVGPARPDALPPLSAIVSGWHTLMRQGAQIDFGDPNRNDTLAVARASALLHAGWLTGQARAVDKATARCVATALTLLGHEDTAEDLRLAARVRPRRRGLPAVDTTFDSSHRAETDPLTLLHDPVAAAHAVAALRAELVDDAEKKLLTLLPPPHAPEAGRSVDVTNLPTNHGPISFALRWHGDKPALLWESPDATNLALRVPAYDADWSTKEKTGEELLVTP